MRNAFFGVCWQDFIFRHVVYGISNVTWLDVKILYTNNWDHKIGIYADDVSILLITYTWSV